MREISETFAGFVFFIQSSWPLIVLPVLVPTCALLVLSFAGFNSGLAPLAKILLYGSELGFAGMGLFFFSIGLGFASYATSQDWVTLYAILSLEIIFVICIYFCNRNLTVSFGFAPWIPVLLTVAIFLSYMTMSRRQIKESYLWNIGGSTSVELLIARIESDSRHMSVENAADAISGLHGHTEPIVDGIIINFQAGPFSEGQIKSVSSDDTFGYQMTLKATQPAITIEQATDLSDEWKPLNATTLAKKWSTEIGDFSCTANLSSSLVTDVQCTLLYPDKIVDFNSESFTGDGIEMRVVKTRPQKEGMFKWGTVLVSLKGLPSPKSKTEAIVLPFVPDGDEQSYFADMHGLKIQIKAFENISFPTGYSIQIDGKTLKVMRNGESEKVRGVDLFRAYTAGSRSLNK